MKNPFKWLRKKLPNPNDIHREIKKHGLVELKASPYRWTMIQDAAKFDKEAAKFFKMAKKAEEKGSHGFAVHYRNEAEKNQLEAKKIKDILKKLRKQL